MSSLQTLHTKKLFITNGITKVATPVTPLEQLWLKKAVACIAIQCHAYTYPAPMLSRDNGLHHLVIDRYAYSVLLRLTCGSYNDSYWTYQLEYPALQQAPAPPNPTQLSFIDWTFCWTSVSYAQELILRMSDTIDLCVRAIFAYVTWESTGHSTMIVVDNNTWRAFWLGRSVMSKSCFRAPAMPGRTGQTVTDQSE